MPSPQEAATARRRQATWITRRAHGNDKRHRTERGDRAALRPRSPPSGVKRHACVSNRPSPKAARHLRFPEHRQQRRKATPYGERQYTCRVDHGRWFAMQPAPMIGGSATQARMARR